MRGRGRGTLAGKRELECAGAGGAVFHCCRRELPRTRLSKSGAWQQFPAGVLPLGLFYGFLIFLDNGKQK